jgi:hypothetical protein
LNHTVPRDVVVPPQQPVPTTSDLTTSPNAANSSLEPEGLARNSRGQSVVGRRPTSAAHGNAPVGSPHPEGVQPRPPEISSPTQQTTTPPPQVPAPASGGTTTRTPCTCGPTKCPSCQIASTLLTIASTQTPRARDPTAPMR